MSMSDFESVGAFHQKFGLATSADGPPTMIDSDLRDFRLKFLLEELTELADGYGLLLNWSLEEAAGDSPERVPIDLPKIADALEDLIYVAHGTLHLHRFPHQALWDDIQRANMSKERCGIDHKFMPQGDGLDLCVMAVNGGTSTCERPKVEHSLRGSAHDVIKPEGWRGPATIEILMRAGWKGPKLL